MKPLIIFEPSPGHIYCNVYPYGRANASFGAYKRIDPSTLLPAPSQLDINAKCSGNPAAAREFCLYVQRSIILADVLDTFFTRREDFKDDERIASFRHLVDVVWEVTE